MNMKLYRGKRVWADLEIDWSCWLVGVDIDREYSYFEHRKFIDATLYLGPIAIIINL